MLNLKASHPIVQMTNRLDIKPESVRGFGESLAPGERNPGCYEAGRGRTRGRQFVEPDCPTRSPFQRDRDRVIHSTAFRRLTHKTQVFLYHEGDHYRSRLTHSLEVAQVARTIARQLRLNEDLAECLALAHDLGHPPFGHAGERALDGLMKDFDGFDHNAQSLRIVMKLEKKYAAFDGLNLTWDVLEGLAKHNGPITEAGSPIERVLEELAGWHEFKLETWPSGEAQVAALADDIAYLTHDLDDGLRAGLITVDQAQNVRLVGGIVSEINRATSGPGGEPYYEIVRQLITKLIQDVIEQSRSRLRLLDPQGPDEIRMSKRAVIAFSESMRDDLQELRHFLFDHVYRSDRVMSVMREAETIIADLFNHFVSDGGIMDMPPAWRTSEGRMGEPQRRRLIADYLAGMTDRYAVAEYRRLFDVKTELL